MNFRIKIGPLLQDNTGLPEVIEVSGETVGDCLENLIRRYPESKHWLYDEDNLIKVLLTINNVETIPLNKEGLGRRLNTGDELQIFAVVSGG